MFKSVVKIKVIAGKGGDGCVSFRREKYVPRGGPDGGDGGKGGDCIIRVNPNLKTLSHIVDGQVFKARDGEPGRGRKQHGADGKDIIIEVPLGTQIIDIETGNIIYDLANPTDQVVIAKGGKGGLGNWHFRSSTNQTPLEFTRGEPGEEKNLVLDLKLIADVGLVGFPNAGKSSLIRTITNATPKVAEYPFTTVYPVLGVLARENTSIIIADLPGIIEDAHLGIGLGLEFLKHIERTKFLIMVVDITDSPFEKIKILLKELVSYQTLLPEKVKIVCFNKIDLISKEEMERFKKSAKKNIKNIFNRDLDLIYTSALNLTNTQKLKKKIFELFLEIY